MCVTLKYNRGMFSVYQSNCVPTHGPRKTELHTARAVLELNIEDRADPGLPPSSSLYTQGMTCACCMRALLEDAEAYASTCFFLLHLPPYARLETVLNLVKLYFQQIILEYEAHK